MLIIRRIQNITKICNVKILIKILVYEFMNALICIIIFETKIYYVTDCRKSKKNHYRQVRC